MTTSYSWCLRCYHWPLDVSRPGHIIHWHNSRPFTTHKSLSNSIPANAVHYSLTTDYCSQFTVSGLDSDPGLTHCGEPSPSPITRPWSWASGRCRDVGTSLTYHLLQQNFTAWLKAPDVSMSLEPNHRWQGWCCTSRSRVWLVELYIQCMYGGMRSLLCSYAPPAADWWAAAALSTWAGTCGGGELGRLTGWQLISCSVHCVLCRYCVLYTALVPTTATIIYV